MPAFTQTIHASANGISLIEAADYSAMKTLLAPSVLMVGGPGSYARLLWTAN